jgi:hypothetical protein
MIKDAIAKSSRRQRLKGLRRWPFRNAAIAITIVPQAHFKTSQEALPNILNVRQRQIPIPMPIPMDEVLLISKAEVFETSAASCGASFAMSSVKSVA